MEGGAAGEHLRQNDPLGTSSDGLVDQFFGLIEVGLHVAQLRGHLYGGGLDPASLGRRFRNGGCRHAGNPHRQAGGEIP